MSKYTIEKHGDGYAIYLGRDWQHHGANIGHLTEVTPATIKLIQDALNATLAQPEQEPVAYVNNDGFIVETSLALKEGTKLYTAPPRKEWVGLTDEEVLLTNGNEEYSIIAAPDAELIEFARTIEAKLKEKNRG